MCVSATDDVEERIAFLEAGADDVMARPFDAREMEARVEALLLRFQRSRDLGPVVSPDGLTLARARRTVAVYSPKGGVGTTTVAVNVAIAAAANRPDKVVLVDLSLQFGGVATLPQPRPQADDRRRRPRGIGAARARAAADLRDAPRQRPPRAGRPGRAGICRR